MKISNTPPAVMARLLALTEQVEALGQAADAAEQKVANARAVLNGQTIPRNFSKGDFAQLRNGFDELLRSANSARHAARIEQTLLANAKQWIETLPSDTVLEPMRVAVDGADLQTVRSSLKIKRERLRVLKLLPLPAPDIAQQVTAYVANLAKLGAPVIRDLQRLQIYWPQHTAATRNNLDGFAEGNAHPLLFAAWFDGERLADKLIEMIEAEVSKVCAPSLRADEISKLECEIAQLTRLDVLLAEQGDAVHDPDTPPMALLGVVVQLSSAAA